MGVQFAVSYPIWLLLLLVAAAALLAWASYAGAIVPLSRSRRSVLSALRALTLLLIVACLLRPVRLEPPDTMTDAVVPMLVDVSRSMGLRDMDGARRIEAARNIVGTLEPALARRVRPELWTFGDGLSQPGTAPLDAVHRRSDLSGALRGIRERYRDRRVAGIVVISDGGDTGAQDAAAVVGAADVPVYTVGVGAERTSFDYEMLDVSAGEATLADASVDLSVAAVSRGTRQPFDLRLLENGRPLDLRRVTPAGDGSPVRSVFSVSPQPGRPTVYTVEVPSAPGETVLENNRRSVLVEPPARRRRILMVEGAPGFEHSFIKRALGADPAFEIDSVVRKGRDARGAATYFVQSTETRAPRLATGFPHERASLYEYDGLILANSEPETLSRAQLQMVADFVDRRGGGLVILGAKTFVNQGFAATPLEEVLPLRLTDRGNGVMRASAVTGNVFSVALTPDGALHPVMRIDDGKAGDLEQRWRSMPRLAGVASLGSLRPGAQALAVASAQDGPRPLVAVQRYGQGHVLLFAGEASWRWRMQMPSSDRTHELFWRQAVRWTATAAPDRVTVASMPPLTPGTSSPVTVDVRNEEFAPLTDAAVHINVTGPDGTTREAGASLVDPATGRYSAEAAFAQPGVYRIRATAVRGAVELGAAVRWVLVGGTDLEMADPRLNDEVLRRIATASGGSYVPAAEADQLPAILAAAQAETAAPRVQELWHNAWVFVAFILLVSTEWMLRRRWGLR